jgi:hypothetical protein
MEVYPSIKEGVINIFPEKISSLHLCEKCSRESKLFIETVYVEYEGDGEEGTSP